MAHATCQYRFRDNQTLVCRQHGKKGMHFIVLLFADERERTLAALRERGVLDEKITDKETKKKEGQYGGAEARSPEGDGPDSDDASDDSDV